MFQLFSSIMFVPSFLGAASYRKNLGIFSATCQVVMPGFQRGQSIQKPNCLLKTDINGDLFTPIM